MESIINIMDNFQSEIKEALANKFKLGKARFGCFTFKKKLMRIFILSCFIGVFSLTTFSQTVEQRKEYYKNMFSKGETQIKSYNTIKATIEDLVFPDTDGHDWTMEETEFQCVFELFLNNFNKIIQPGRDEYHEMNQFKSVPEMDYLKKMNIIQEKQISLLAEGIKFFEEISTEVNSKPFKRWDARVIDAFVNTSILNNQLQMFKRLRPVSYQVYLLNRSRDILSYLQGSYANWQFLLSINEPDLSSFNTNPFLNYSNVSFLSYRDNSLFSSWMAPVEVKNILLDKNKKYSKEMANSSNALALSYLVSTLDFKNSLLSQLFKNTNLQIKKWTIVGGPEEEKKVEKKKNLFDEPDPEQFYKKKEEPKMNYDGLDYSDALDRVNSDAIVSYLMINKVLIKNLSEIVPISVPYFYVHAKPKLYLENVANFDKESFLVYEIKHDLILVSAYLNSICNDFKMSKLDDKILNDWLNKTMDKENLKAYFKNESMLEFNKTNTSIWTADKIQLSSILDKLRIIKLSLRSNSTEFIEKYNLLTDSNNLISILNQNSIAENKVDLDSFIISQYETEHIFTDYFKAYQKGEKTASKLNSLGWRCLLNFEYEVAVNFLNDAMKLSDNNIMITLNLAHAELLKGDFKNAKELYLKFPLDAISPELKLDVKTIIINDFEDFKRVGVNPSTFDLIRKELGI